MIRTRAYVSTRRDNGELGVILASRRDQDAVARDALIAAQRCNPRVVAISLKGDDITSENASLLPHILSLRELAILAADDEAMAKLKPIPKLEKLTLSFGHAPLSCDIAENLLDYSQLSYLSLQHGQLRSEAFRSLGKLTRLNVLRISSCRGMDESALMHIAELPNLEELSIMDTKCACDAAALASIRSLKSLRLGRTSLGGTNLSALSTLDQLEFLAMNDITDEQIKGIVAFPNLRGFVTESPLLTDKALDFICQLKKLDSLYVAARHISLSEDEMKSKMPTLKGVCLVRLHLR